MRAFTGLVGMGLLAVSASGVSAASESMSADQKKAIQSVVHEYLVTQPEVLIEAGQALQKKQQDHMQAEVSKVVTTHTKELLNSPLSTVGNAKGSVTVVEFFDYQCGHCKSMGGVMDAVIKKSPNVRVIYKDFPIFGEASAQASAAALAAGMQHQYLAMHDALLKAPGHLTEAQIFEIAKKLNLNIDQLKKDMQSTQVTTELKNNRTLAEVLQLMGTPALIILPTPNGGGYKEGQPVMFVPGAATEATLLGLIKKAE